MEWSTTCSVLNKVRGLENSPCENQQVIFIQEAFPGGAPPGEEAPMLTGYVSYVHYTRRGLITYIHSSIPHTLLGSSAQVDMTFQLFEITVGNGTLRLCNVYSAPGVINLPVLPIPTDSGMIYMGDFNARHPALGDSSSTPNRGSKPLLDYIRRYRLTRRDIGGATHARGGYCRSHSHSWPCGT
ncbi:hypothetical protein SK128_009505 [Halocaridina rubra]|uniref:Endonuclease/exonuclease/phosphatase domain-containing protein n=1 Tax=Halocaridina rubra TaxID=373956 RepID=A0AAN8W947_HALRR